MKNIIFKSKKAQHEIVGFVLIVLVVVIIGLIFLAFTISNKDTQKKTSSELSDFLQSSMFYTTDCAINNIPNYQSLQELIALCYGDNSSFCLNGEGVCESLNKTLNNVIIKNLKIGYKNKAFELNMYFDIKNSTIPKEYILDIQSTNFNNCSSISGTSAPIPYVSGLKTGNIWIELDVCKE
jgi:hypothetical protein